MKIPPQNLAKVLMKEPAREIQLDRIQENEIKCKKQTVTIF